jgi:tetratricopeptide (TPR) repeat protein
MKVTRRPTLFYRPPFYRRPSNIYRLFALAVLIISGVWLSSRLGSGVVRNPFEPTPTGTRTTNSWLQEGQAYFEAGKLDDPNSDQDAVFAYQQATQVDPNDAKTWAELGRIQAYSSRLLSNDSDRLVRLTDALASVDRAAALAPEDSEVLAIRAFVLDWNADPFLDGLRSGGKTAADFIFEAEQVAFNAISLDNKNALAYAFYCEILVDQQKWDQAAQYIDTALELGSKDMDVYRVHGQYLESIGEYQLAIEAYQKALQINPNLTFLYISVGQNYRTLGFKSPIGSAQDAYYEQAIETFAQAVRINNQLGIKDPLPYLAISKVYAQQGQFLAASLNAEKAVELDPTNADLYGQLGNIYKRGRNFETSIFALKCAVKGCTPAESCEARNGCLVGEVGVQVQPLSLNPNSATYYLDYGSVLSAFAPIHPEYCADVFSVLNLLKQTYPDNTVIVRNADVGLSICEEVTSGLTRVPAVTAAPGSTQAPAPTRTSTPSPYPTATP